MAESTRPRALVFDAYGTLLEVASIEAAASSVTVRPAELVDLWRAKQLEYSFLAGLMGHYRDFWQLTADALDFAADRLKLRLSPAQRQRLLDAWLTVAPYPEVAVVLTALAARDITLAVLSNGTPAMLQSALDAAGIRHHFTHVMSVGAVRTFKPHPSVYQLAPATLGLAPSELLFVSSNGWDVAGAAQFGLPTAWVNRRNLPRERLGPPPTYQIADLVGLLAIAAAEDIPNT